MIQVTIRRAGLICLAATVNDFREVQQAWGFTQEGASRRLLRRLDRLDATRRDSPRGVR